MAERRVTQKGLFGSTEGQSPLGEPRHRWESNGTIDLNAAVLEGVDWINLVRGKEHAYEPPGCIKFTEFYD